MCASAMMYEMSSAYMLFTIKIFLLVLLFASLLVMLGRQREMINVLKQIRDKK